MQGKEIGSVVCTIDGPSSTEFSFVVTRSTEGDVPVRRGQLVELKGEEGEVIGSVTEILKTNRYFERAEAVKEFERSAPIRTIFPVDRWEYVIATAKLMGVRNSANGRFVKADYPPSPGEKVYLAEDELISDILGFEREDGLYLGTLYQHSTKVSLNLTRLLQKHAALLGISGGGKSYLASVMIEELLSRRKEQGRLAIVVVDVHGEYTSLAEKPSETSIEDYSGRVTVVKGSYFEIAARHLSPVLMMELAPQMSVIQARELSRIFDGVKKRSMESKQPFSLPDIIKDVESDEHINPRSKEALLGWLFDLESLKIVGREENPSLDDALAPGKAVIIDLSDTVNLRRKQIIVTYLATRLFSLRRREEVPPFVMILEEAHQFCPEGSKIRAPSRGIIETIAREGRKFFASLVLISQRPVRLSTTVLSQCNTHIVMRVTNPYDLQHIGESSEGIDRPALDIISSLRAGEALIVGSAVNFPIFMSIRKRKSNEPRLSRSLEEVARRFDS
ncbi:MAG: ATP-binding protein [Promethearchaeati archaeon SRVP18_Atabeyarchaeia-1]